ncbi:OmpA family protein [Ferruginibacter sp. SUN106]|uniref:OmpA family protein n=1 Tax=Ferruginibacter sp. SUN106 TaxID=2978348 RepID=UPI003D36B3E3
MSDHIRLRIVFAMLFVATAFSLNAQTILVKTIYFKPGSFSIDKKYFPMLDHVARQLGSDSMGFLKVFGFADTKGKEDDNDELSSERANAVYDYLANHAVFDTTRVYVGWIGESADAYDLHFPQAHIQQRCVDIYIQFWRKKE